MCFGDQFAVVNLLQVSTVKLCTSGLLDRVMQGDPLWELCAHRELTLLELV